MRRELNITFKAVLPATALAALCQRFETAFGHRPNSLSELLRWSLTGLGLPQTDFSDTIQLLDGLVPKDRRNRKLFSLNADSEESAENTDLVDNDTWEKALEKWTK